MGSAAQQLGMPQFQWDDVKAVLLEKLDERGLVPVDDNQIRINAERVHIDPIATDAFGNVLGIMRVRIFHWSTVDDLPLFQYRRQRMVVETTWIAQDQPGTQGHEGRVDVAAEIYVLEEMDSVFIAQYALQPFAAHFIARGADEINQVLAETKDVCRIEGRLVVARRRLLQIDAFEKRVQKHRLRRAVPSCARLHVVDQQRTIAEGLLSAAPDHIGCFNDLVPNHQHDVPRAIVIVPLGFPVDGRERGFMGPDVRALYRDAGLLQDVLELV